MTALVVTDRLLAFVKGWEGFEADAYQDVAGVWTIGYGHTGEFAEPGMAISEATASSLLASEVADFAEQVLGALGGAATTQEEFEAFVSLAYNIGGAAFARSTALKRHIAGDHEGAAEAIEWWNKATVNGRKQPFLGLTRRRAAERALYLSAPRGVVSAADLSEGLVACPGLRPGAGGAS